MGSVCPLLVFTTVNSTMMESRSATKKRDGTTIAEFIYNDGGNWPDSPDGQGTSLTLNTFYANPDLNNPLYWQSSSVTGGTPGTGETGGTTFPGGSAEDLDNYGFGNDGTRPYSTPTFNLVRFGGSVHGVLSFRANTSASDLIMHVEHSEKPHRLGQWQRRDRLNRKHQ